MINCFNLRQGNFELALEYVSDEDTAASVQADNDKAFDIAMPAGETVVSTSFSLLHPTDRFKITIPGSGNSMVIKAVRLNSGDYIDVEQADTVVKFIRFPEHSYFNVLNTKLNR